MTSEQTDSRATADAQESNEIIACTACGYEWVTRSDMERVTCPSCQHKTERTVIAEQQSMQARSVVDGAESLEELAQRHRDRSDTLRTLGRNGWSLQQRVQDGWTHLIREIAGGDQDGD